MGEMTEWVNKILYWEIINSSWCSETDLLVLHDAKATASCLWLGADIVGH